MADASTIANISALYKTIYRAGEVPNVAMKNHPFFSRVRKLNDFFGGASSGGYLSLPVLHGNGVARSATFSNAQTLSVDTYAGPSKMKAWLLDRKHDYAQWTIDAESMIASRKDIGAFMELRRMEADGYIRQLGNSLSHAMFRDGWGAVGVLASGHATSGTTVTLADPEDTDHLDIGMQLTISDGSDGSTPRTIASDAYLRITAINRDAGTFTVHQNLNTVTSVAAGDYLFLIGDNDRVGTTRYKVAGLDAWLPLTAPSSTAFFGVDRSVDTVRLGGNRLDNTSGSIQDNVLTVSEKCFRHGGNPDCVYIHPTNFDTLIKDLGAKVEYEGAGGEAKVGFSTVTMHAPGGAVKVYADPDCPSNRGYVLQMDTWELHHMEELPHIVADEGLQATRSSSTDGIQVRARYWANLACRAPGFNGVFSI